MTFRRSPLFLAAALLSLCATPAHARYWHWAEFTLPRYPGEYLHRIRTDRVATPHLAFARPLAGGPVKALFIVPKAGVQTRDVVELWQRLDLEFEAVTIGGAEDICDDFPFTTAVVGESTPEKERELSEKLDRPYDVIVLANCNLDFMPAESVAKILRAVRDGTGLVGVFDNTKPKKLDILRPLVPPVAGRDLLKRCALVGLPYFGIGEKAPREKVADETVTAARFGKGRIVWLNYGKAAHTKDPWYAGDCLGRPAAPTPEGYDAAMAIAARAVLWAARREPAVEIGGAPEDGTVVARAAWPGRVSVTVRSAGAFTGPVSVEALFARADGLFRAAGKGTAPVAGGVGAVCDIALPRPPRGTVFLYLVARDAKGAVLDYGVTALTVAGEPAIASAAVEREPVEPGSAAGLNVEISGTIPAGAVVAAEATDAWDRVAWRGEAAARPSVRLEMPTRPVCGRYARVVLRLKAGEEVLDAAETEVFIRRDLGPDFVNLMWGHPGVGVVDWQVRGYVRGLVGKLLQRLGFNVGMLFTQRVTEVREAARSLSRTDTQWMYYISHVQDGNVRASFDPAAREKDEKALEELAREVKPYGTLFYSLGDENNYAVHDDMKPAELAAYREYLKGEYRGDVGALNRAWGTSYAGFEAVEAAPKGVASISPKYDLKTFWERAYAETHHRKRDAIRRGDPTALVGAEGSAFGDLEYTISKLDWFAPYEDRMGNALLRFWVAPASLRGNWWGSYTANHGARSGPPVLWHQLATGSVNASMFFVASLGSEGMLAADAGPAEFYERWRADMDSIRSTAGPLLRAAVPIDDGVGIFWSRRSEVANELDGRFGSGLSAQGELVAAFDAAGINAKFVTERQILAGKLSPATTKILFVCVAKAVSDELAGALEAYLRAGGTVVADVAPDIRDAHCAPAAPGRLLRLFGVKSAGEPKPVSAPISFSDVPLGPAAVSLDTGPCFLDASVSGDGTAPLAKAGDAPVLFVRSHGTGRAVFLNFNLYNALVQARSPKAATTAGTDFLLAIAAAAGVKPEFVPRAGLPWETVRRFRHADATIVGLDRWRGGPGIAEFAVGKGRFVHSLREGIAADAAGSMALPAERPDSILLSVMPAGPREVRVAAPGRARPGETVSCSVSVAAGGRPLTGSLVRVDVREPDGAVLEAHRRFVESGGRPAVVEWPVALNAAAGTYTVEAVELLSGKAGKATVAVGR